MTLEEYEARAKAVLRVRRNGPGDDEVTAADVLARDLLALVARVRELEARGPVMPETPSNAVHEAVNDFLAGETALDEIDFAELWEIFRIALMEKAGADE